MVEKTKQDIARTCFAWRPTHDVPKTRKAIAWFEILRSDDGTGQTTSFNAIVDTRAIKDQNKCHEFFRLNAYVADALRPIGELGIQGSGSGYDPIVVETPPAWLDRFFETLAGLLEKKGKTPGQMTEAELTALGQEAMLTVTTRDPPKPPPFAGSGWKPGRAL